MSREASTVYKATILVINSGSSSIKFKLFDMRADWHIAVGRLEGIDGKDATLRYAYGSEPFSIRALPALDYATALSAVFSLLKQEGLVRHPSELGAIGHEGERYSAPALIDENLFAYLETINKLAPLHNVASLFTVDKPIIFNFHGYPWLIHRLVYRRTNHRNLQVRGCKEKGNINTPLELAMDNEIDRFSLAIDVINRVPWLQVTGAHAKEKLRDLQIDCRQYAHVHGVDKPEIREWRWPY